MRDSRAFRAVVWFALGIIPMIYAGLLVWSNQDPTGELSHVPAAIVNEDAGTTVTAADGTATAVHLGDQLETRLTAAADPAFDWSVLDADAAAKQLAAGRVLAVLTIPAGFSADVSSAAVAAPDAGARSGELEIRTDDAQNFIVGTVAKSVATTVADALSAEVRQQYLEGVYDSFGSLADRLGQAADGGSRLAAGATTLRSGTDEVSSGSARLAGGLGSLAAGAQQVAGGADAALSGAQQLDTGLTALAEHWSLLPDAQREAIVAQLAAGAGGLVGSAQDGTGLAGLAAGSSRLSSSASSAASGATAVASGAAKAANGASQLAAGAADLSSQLAAGAGQVPAYTGAEAAARAAIAAQPVLLDAVREHSVGVYGAGLLPYFLSLGLWVGALGTFMMRAPLSEPLLRRRGLPAPLVALRSAWPTAILGLVQAAAAVLVLRFWVDIPMAELAGVAGVAALASLTFLAVNQGLVALLGPVGRFIALLLVVLQLASAGGTYPVQTAAPFFQAIHGWLPVSHSMSAFRMLVAGGTQSVLPDLLVLLAWLLGGLGLTTLGVVLQRRREARALGAVAVAVGEPAPASVAVGEPAPVPVASRAVIDAI